MRTVGLPGKHWVDGTPTVPRGEGHERVEMEVLE